MDFLSKNNLKITLIVLAFWGCFGREILSCKVINMLCCSVSVGNCDVDSKFISFLCIDYH